MTSKNNKKPKDRNKKQRLGKGIFAKFFAFEKGVEITKEDQVLKRKNEVIKNIIFLINLLLFVMMMIFSIATLQVSNKNNKIINWVITAATFPLTFVINFFLKKLIKKSKEQDDKYNIAKQHIAMYFSIIYLLLIVLLFYLKINFPTQNTLLPKEYKRFAEPFSYLFFYLVLIICALYQDKKFLFNINLIIFAILTLVHFLITHNTIEVFQSTDVTVKKVVLTDIMLRTLIYITISIVLYATTSISVSLLSKRKEEYEKRKETEENFKTISEIIFDLVLTSPKHYFREDDCKNIYLIAKYLATILGFSKDECEYLENYSKIHLEYDMAKSYENLDFDSLKKYTFIFSQVIKRIQLFNKSEAIIRSYTEKRITKDFIFYQNKIQKNDISNCLLISEIYYRLRSPQDYKAPLRHVDAISVLENELVNFFEKRVLEAFLSFSNEFDRIYQELN